MSIALMSLVWKHGPPDRSQRLLMLAIADSANDQGICWPSTKLLAGKSCMSVRSVLRSLKALEQQGWLSVKRKSYEAKGNRYEIILARLGASVSHDTVSHDKLSRDTTGISQVTNQAESRDKTGNPPHPLLGRTIKNHQETSAAAVSSKPSGPIPQKNSQNPVLAIYTAYPRQVGKAAALKAITAAIERLKAEGRTLRDAQVLLYQATVAFAQSPAGNSGEFTPHPATWFNKGRYEDDRSEWQRQGGSDQRQQRTGTSTSVSYADPDTLYSGPEYDTRTHSRGAA